MKYRIAEEGKYFFFCGTLGHRIACCSCGLVHVWYVKVIKGEHLLAKVYLLPRSTTAIRREMKKRGIRHAAVGGRTTKRGKTKTIQKLSVHKKEYR